MVIAKQLPIGVKQHPIVSGTWGHPHRQWRCLESWAWLSGLCHFSISTFIPNQKSHLTPIQYTKLWHSLFIRNGWNIYCVKLIYYHPLMWSPMWSDLWPSFLYCCLNFLLLFYLFPHSSNSLSCLFLLKLFPLFLHWHCLLRRMQMNST